MSGEREGMGERRDEHQPRRRGRPPKPLDADGSSAARLGVELRRCRERRGLTQGALAAVIGYSPQHLSEVERGAGSVSEQFVQACDDALGADGQLVKLLAPVVYERARARWADRAERHSGVSAQDVPSSFASQPGVPTDCAEPPRVAPRADSQVIAEMPPCDASTTDTAGGMPAASCWAISTERSALYCARCRCRAARRGGSCRRRRS